MNFTTKVYLYDSSKSDYRGTDYSKYVLLGDSDEDNLDDTLDTYTLTLAGLNTREEFAPSTEFIVEKWQDDVLINTWDFVVQSDSVEQPIISEDGYFDHHLTLIEAGAIAQHRLVDNIAVTYKLQDVSLDQVPTYDVNQKVNVTNINAVMQSETNYTAYKKNDLHQLVCWGHKFEWVMPTWVESSYSFDTWKNLLYNQVIETSTGTLSLPIPIIRCYSPSLGTTNLDVLNGYCSVLVTISEKQGSSINTDTYIVLPNSNDDTEKVWTADTDIGYGVTPLKKGEIYTKFNLLQTYIATAHFSGVTKWGTDYNGTLTSTTTPFTTLTNRLLTITIKPECKYSINISRLSYPKSNWSGSSTGVVTQLTYDEYPTTYYYLKQDWFSKKENAQYTNYNYPVVSVEFNCYKQGETGKIIFQSAPPATAYDLFNKCQIASTTIDKVSGTTIDETPKMYYLGEDDKTELQNTTIIENFYNQKNLWELFMDIGKYIHARPKIVYGEDDKFRVEWKRYGQTAQYTDNATPISVYNSKFIEEYIASVSSYVSNMVQLNGSITELIAPKSNSEDYLVYNDVAELITTKPIIELLELVAINNTGEERYLATNDYSKLIHGERKVGYVFEENIWKTLDVVETVNVNKGNSIYYKLGTNKIQGLNYRLPKENSDADYAFKMILAEVFGIGEESRKNIKINDYTFRITYRTKDTLRTDVTRPDLRKYLFSGKYDKVPIHQQFNNQQDVVVDSEKFGNNLFGTLIRTGNSVFSRVEWVDDLTKLKHSGELYEIYDNLYYVSKVKNTYYGNYATSEVEFTKDFNRLSQIIGIPSEPRFYEISEQSSIDREISIDDYFLVGTKTYTGNYVKNYLDKYFTATIGEGRTLSTVPGIEYLYKLISGLTGRNSYYPDLSVNADTTGTYYVPQADLTFKAVILPTEYVEGLSYYVKLDEQFPKYAISIFKGDINKNSNFKKAIISPVSTYTVGTTLTMEWDMVDNFSAGDKVIPTKNSLTTGDVDKAYNELQSVCYTDTYGRADLLDFAIIPDLYLSSSNAEEKASVTRNIPECPESIFKVNDDGTIATNKIVPLFGNEMFGEYGTNDKGIGLLKDNREVIKVNYNIQMLTDSDRFVLSSYLWQPNKGSLKLALLNEEVNKLSTNTVKLGNNVLATYDVSVDDFYGTLRLDNILSGVDLTDVKSICLYSSNIINQTQGTEEHYFVIARNVTDLDNTEKAENWKIERPRVSLFTNKQ